MFFVSTAEDLAHPIRKLVSRQRSPPGSTTLRLPRTHLGSMALSHGLFLGSKQGTIRTPRPLSLTSRLRVAIQSLTNLLLCQLVLSQIKSRAFFPLRVGRTCPLYDSGGRSIPRAG
jgi:hypothetical protein